MTPARWARVALAGALLAAVWLSLDRADALDRLRSVRGGWIVAAVAALTVQTVLAAWRWRLTAAQFGLRLGVRQSIAEYYLSQIVNQMLPGGVLGDVGRALRSAGPAGLARAGQAVVIERVIGNLALLGVMLGAVAAALAVPGMAPLPGRFLALAGGGALVVLAVGGVIWTLDPPVPPAPGAPPALPARVGAGLRRNAATARRAVAAGLLNRHVLPRQIALNVAAVGANIAAFDCAARATGTQLPLAAALVLTPLILFVMMIPVTVAGWGLREGAAAALFPLAGFGSEAGLAASVAFGVSFLVSSLPGVPVMLVDAARQSARPVTIKAAIPAVAIPPPDRPVR